MSKWPGPTQAPLGQLALEELHTCTALEKVHIDIPMDEEVCYGMVGLNTGHVIQDWQAITKYVSFR